MNFKFFIFLFFIFVILVSISVLVYFHYANISVSDIFSPKLSGILGILSNQEGRESSNLQILNPYYNNGQYKVYLTGNESMWVKEVKIDGDNITIIAKEEKDRTYNECVLWDEKNIDKLGIMKCLKYEDIIYYVPDTLPVKDDLGISKDTLLKDDRLIDGKIQSEFKYVLDSSYTKIGYNSIIIIEDVSSTGDFNNVVPENTYSHLNISDSSLVFYLSMDVNLSNTTSLVTHDYTNTQEVCMYVTSFYNETGWQGGSAQGAGGYLDCGLSPATLFDRDISIFMWVKKNDSFSRDIIGHSYNNWYLRFTGDYIELLDDNVASVLLSNTNVTLEEWIFIGITINQTGSLTIWNNAVANGTKDISNNLSSDATRPLHIGGGYLGLTHLQMDETMIFSKALTSAEVSQLYLQTYPRFFGTGTVMYNFTKGADDNMVNVTLSYQNFYDTNISVRTECNGVNSDWTTAINLDNITLTADTGTECNLTVNLTSDTNNYYTPNLLSLIIIDTWINEGGADTTAPVLTIEFPTNITYNVNITDLNYTVTEANPDSCWYSIDLGVTNSTIIASETNFTDVESVEGSNNWTIWCNDTGNYEGTSGVVFIKDLDIPTFTDIFNTTINQGDNVYQDINATDITTSVDCFIVNDTTNFKINCSGTLENAIALTPEIYWINITVNDTANNQDSIEINVTVLEAPDTTTPLIYIQYPENATYNYNTLDFNITANENLSSCNFTIDSWTTTYDLSSFNSTLFNYTYSAIPDSQYTANFDCLDLTYNENNTEQITFIIDTIPPTFTDVFNTTINQGEEVYMEINATDITTSIDCFIINDTTNFTIDCLGILINSTNLLPEIYWLNVTINDTANNLNSIEINVTILLVADTTPPQLTIEFPANTTYSLTQIDFNVTANEDVTCNFTIDSWVTYPEMTEFNSTFFTFTNDSMVDGQYTAEYTCNDSAGNINDTENIVFVINTSVPPVTGNISQLDYTYDLADIHYVDSEGSCNYGIQMKWDITNISASSTINDAILCMYIENVSDTPPDNDVSVWYVTNETWDESIADTPAGRIGIVNMDASSQTNVTHSSITLGELNCINVTTQLQQAYTNGNSNFTLRLEDTDYLVHYDNLADVGHLWTTTEYLILGYDIDNWCVPPGSDVWLNFSSREATSNQPYLNITYSTAETTVCKNFDTDNEVYTMINDIASASTCYYFNAVNVTLNGNNHILNMTGSGNAIFVNTTATNFTVKDLTINGPVTAVNILANQIGLMENIIINLTNPSNYQSAIITYGDEIEFNNIDIQLANNGLLSGVSFRGTNSTFENFWIDAPHSNSVALGFRGTANNNTITTGNIVRGGYCVARYDTSYDNFIYDNFLNCTTPTYMATNTLFNTTQTAGTNIMGNTQIGGNYWARMSSQGYSDTCGDANADGLCDVAYGIPGGGTDYLPYASVDVANPEVYITSPLNNSARAGVTVLTSYANDNKGILNVTYFYSNSTTDWTYICSVASYPYSCNWDTDLLSDDAEGYDINVTAYDISNLLEDNISHFLINRQIPSIKDLLVIYPAGQTSAKTNDAVSFKLNTSSPAGIYTTKMEGILIGTAWIALYLESGSKNPNEWGYYNRNLTIIAADTGLNYSLINVTDKTIPSNSNDGDSFEIRLDNENTTYDGLMHSPDTPYNTTTTYFTVNAHDNYKLKSCIFQYNFTGEWQNDSCSFIGTQTDASVSISKVIDLIGDNWTYNFLLYDDAGNFVETTTNNVTVIEEVISGDIITVNLLYPADLQNFNVNTFDFNYSYGNGVADNCTLFLDNLVNDSHQGPDNYTTYSFTETMAEGSHSWYVECYDNLSFIGYGSDNQRSFIIDTTYPVFSDYWDDNASILGSGNANFNITITGGNGTAYLDIDGNWYYAANESDVYSVSVFLSTGVYQYNWSSYGNGLNANYNISENYAYDVNESDIIAPDVNIEFPTNTTYNVDVVDLNYTVEEDNPDSCWYSKDLGLTNSTPDITMNNFTMSSSDGTNDWIVYCNDTANNLGWAEVIFVRDLGNPGITIEFPANATYSLSQIDFNITGNEDLSSCNLTLDAWTTTNQMSAFNLTLFNYTNESIGDGQYTANFWCNDTSNNVNDTEAITFVIDTIPPVFTDIFNTTINQGEEVYMKINATDTTSGVDCFTINDTTNFTIDCTGLLINATLLLPETYWLNVTVNDTANNHDSIEINVTILTIADTTEPYFVDIPSELVLTYGERTFADFNGTDNIALDSYAVNDSLFAIDANGILSDADILGVGVYYVNITINDTSNNLNSTEYNITINQASQTSTLSINETSPISYGLYINVTCNGELYRNDVNITEEIALDMLLGFGNYNFSCQLYGDENYSFAEDNETFNINPASSSIYGYVNESRGDFSATNTSEYYHDDINLTCILIIGIGDIELDLNGSVMNTGASPLENITNLSMGDTYNMTCLYAGNENYSASQESWDITISLPIELALTIIIHFPKNISYDTSQLDLNVTVSGDVAVDTVWYSLDESTNITFVPNITLLNLGYESYHSIKVFANNTESDMDWQEVKFYIGSNPEMWLWIVLFIIFFILLVSGIYWDNYYFTLASGILIMIMGIWVFNSGISFYAVSEFWIYPIAWILTGLGLIIIFFSAFSLMDQEEGYITE